MPQHRGLIPRVHQLIQHKGRQGQVIHIAQRPQKRLWKEIERTNKVANHQRQPGLQLQRHTPVHQQRTEQMEKIRRSQEEFRPAVLPPRLPSRPPHHPPAQPMIKAHPLLLSRQEDLVVPFEFQDATLPGDLPNDPALSPIEVSLSVEESAGMLFFVILNSSDQLDCNIDGTRPVVTSIFIEDPNDILGGGGLGLFESGVGTAAGEGVNYDDSDVGGSLPGDNNISFTSTFHFDPSSPPSKNGIDPDESGTFKVGTADAATVMTAIANNEIRGGIHIQQIGTNAGSSAAFVLDGNAVPEPSSALLSLLGAGALLLRRKRPSLH